jgi:hypothetical protein
MMETQDAVTIELHSIPKEALPGETQKLYESAIKCTNLDEECAKYLDEVYV